MQCPDPQGHDGAEETPAWYVQLHTAMVKAELMAMNTTSATERAVLVAMVDSQRVRIRQSIRFIADDAGKEN